MTAGHIATQYQKTLLAKFFLINKLQRPGGTAGYATRHEIRRQFILAEVTLTHLTSL